MKEKIELPTIKDLVSDVVIYEKQDEFNFLMNQPPPKIWIKKHPFVNNHFYLPIDKIEYLLRKIFKKYRIEILREGTSFNGVYVVVRVHYKDLITNEWEYHDGIGAIHLQVKSGSSPSDLSNINYGALSMAFPLAKTLAIKDACDMFGKLFGADLNRRDTLNPFLDSKEIDHDAERITLLIKSAKNQEELDFAKSHASEKYVELIKEKQTEINKK